MASWRHISLLLSFLGLFAACVIFGMLFWMTSKIESVEQEKTQALIRLKINATMEGVRLGVEDYAYWTHAHDLVAAGDSAGIYEDLGSGATDADLFDQLFILSSDGNLLHAFDENLGEQAHSLFDEAAFGEMWQALEKFKPIDYQSVASVLEIDDEYSIVVAAWITPDAITETPDMPLAAMFGVIHLSEQMLQALGNDAQISDVVLAKYKPENTDEIENQSLIIRGLNDTPIALLSWNMQSVGAALRQELLPLVLMVTLCIVFICGSAARYFRSQHVALRTANVVATTDQLTGLLNRAGLAEKLKTRAFSESLERGHLAAIYLDLNDFKELNDSLGHKAGDIALRVTAERLQSASRASDIVVRLGGDEFLCIVMDPQPETTAVTVAQRILELTALPISFDDHQKVIAPSVGLAVSKPGTQWETLLSQSDAAMFWSKQRKANHPIIFCKSMDDADQAA